MMIDNLEAIDRAIVLTINSWNNPLLDEVMWLISGKLTWIPFYAFLLYLFFRQSGLKKSIVFLICAVAVVAITDQVSVHLFKEMFLRYRPSHHALLTERLHFYEMENGELYKGGMYGFISSHASNFLAVCTFSFLALRRTYPKIIIALGIAAFLVIYSRLYLGVHYLSDVFAGAFVGILVAFLVFRFVFIPILGKEFYKK